MQIFLLFVNTFNKNVFVPAMYKELTRHQKHVKIITKKKKDNYRAQKSPNKSLNDLKFSSSDYVYTKEA